MKTHTFISFVVVASLFTACGPEIYAGRLASSQSSRGEDLRSAEQKEIAVVRGEDTIELQGLGFEVKATCDGDALELIPGGQVLGGSGRINGSTLSFTVWSHSGETITVTSFTGELGQLDGESMRDVVSSSGMPVAEISSRPYLNQTFDVPPSRTTQPSEGHVWLNQSLSAPPDRTTR